MKLLDEKGLTTVWAAIKNTFLTKSDASSYSLKGETVKNIIIQKNGYTQENSGASQVLHIFKANGEDEWLTIENASSGIDGFMSRKDKVKLDGIALNANNYSLPLAATSTRGGIQLGYSQNGRNYPVQLSGEKAYVNVPWTDTNTTYDLSSYSQKDETVKNIVNSMFGNSLNGYKQILEIDYANGTHKTVEISNASGGMNGFMSSSDKDKLDNIAAGANNYTLPVASDTTLGGIKTGFNPRSGSYSFKVNVDVNGNANTFIPGLMYGNEDYLSQVQIATDSEEHVSLKGDKISFHDQEGVETNELLIPKKTGTFAITSETHSFILSSSLDKDYHVPYRSKQQTVLADVINPLNVDLWYHQSEVGDILDIYTYGTAGKGLTVNSTAYIFCMNTSSGDNDEHIKTTDNFTVYWDTYARLIRLYNNIFVIINRLFVDQS